MNSTIPMFSGVLVDLINPNPADVLISDVAHHLSLINRYTGATRYGYSVGEHSLQVAYTTDCLEGLMHDAHEAYIGDVSSPLKQHLPEYQRIESMWEELMIKKFNLDPDVLLNKVKPVDVSIRDRETPSYMGRYGMSVRSPVEVELDFLRAFDFYNRKKVRG